MRNLKKILSLLLAIVFVVALVKLPSTTTKAEESSESVLVKVIYSRADNDYSDWDIWMWSKTNPGEAIEFSGQDQNGAYVILETTKDSDLGFLIRKKDWSDKFVQGDIKPDLSQGDVQYVAVDDGTSRTLETTAIQQSFEKVNLNLHYYRLDEDYTDWDVWSWVNDGAAYPFEDDEFGKVTKISYENVGESDNIGFIIRKTDWSQKDWDGDRFINKAYINADGNVDAYVIQGIEKVYYSEEAAQKAIEDAKNPRVLTAKIDTLSTVTFTTNTLLEDDLTGKLAITSGEESLSISSITVNADKKSGTIILGEDLDLNKKYTLAIDGCEGKELVPGKIYDSEEFASAYTYTGNLGALYSKNSTEFVLWAPTASNVKVALYGTNGTSYTSEAEQVVPMTQGENGTWKVTVDGDLNGQYYNYLVSVDGKVNEVVDPYAKAVGVNGNRGMVIDLDSTNPEGWDKDVSPVLEDATDAIIYEMHIRDFTISETSGTTLEYKGKYNGVWQSGTTIPGSDVKTGVDHLKELGVNVVHILPTFDHQSIDETKLDTPQFNWGYDPKNYNVPEGSYSSDPYAAEIRIEEFKEMVMELHKAGIRVVMDVVYNHTGATLDSNLNLAVPNYYYRQNAEGGFSNASGCGNETASDRSMVNKLIVDSVAYWAEEYHIDGFRFDLMAIHDIDTMKDVRNALDTIDPSILVYGEGWTGGESPLSSDKQALKANVPRFEQMQIAAFSDDMRDGIKGHVFTDTAPAFINGGQGFEETIKFGIVASTPNDQIDYSKVANQTQPWANQPYQTINYASAHDNLTLWDKLQTTNPDASEEELVAMNKMSAAIIYTSQGIPFMQAGEEMARTKVNADGTLNENSYNAPDSVNQIDWTRKVTYSNLYDYYKGLISLRKSHKVFRMNNTSDIQANLNFLDVEDANVVAYTLNGEEVGDAWDEIAVLFNSNKEDVKVTLPSEDWVVVVNGETAGVTSLGEVEGNVVTIPAQSSYVLVDKASYTEGVIEEKPSGEEDNNTPSNEKDNGVNTENNNPSNGSSNNAPTKTGDNNEIIVLGIIFIISVAGIVVFARKKKTV